MLWFTVATGLATLLSLFLQVSGILGGDRKRYLAYSTLFLAGLTIGLLLNAAFSVNVVFPETVTPRQLLGLGLYSGASLLAMVLIILGVITQDPDRRREARVAGSAVSGFLIFLLMFFLNSFFGRT